MKDRLTDIVRRAGAIISESRAKGVQEKAGHGNFVTEIDKKVEAFLKKELTALLPEAQFIGEEQENEALGGGLAWVVDPLDGTCNFIHDYRMSAVSVALLEGGRPVMAAVCQPYTGEMFFAEKGKGAQLNGEAIRVTEHDLAHALVGFGTSPYDTELAETSMALALDYLTQAADVRRTGSAALDLAYVACGRQDVFFELRLRPWDYAAGALLVTEAGGVFDMPFCAGGADFGATDGVFASNAACCAAARALFDARTAK